MPEWPLSATYFGILVQKDFMGVKYISILENRNMEELTVICAHMTILPYMHAMNIIKYT